MSHVIRINNNVIQITDLLKCLMQFEDDCKLTPSRYNKEVGMNVDERLKLLNDRSRKQRIGRHNKLWTIPDIVVFQNFETHVSYTTSISFMHQKQHPVRIKVVADLSPSFSLKELPGTVYSKLAPGTPHKMTLDFYSEEYRDYSCLVRFEADDDVVYLPVVALAPRPIIIFPDVIEMTETVVNISSDKKVFMKNMGKSPVVFKLKADSPFSVCPRTGIMEPNEILDVQVSYKTFRVEKNVSDLTISFEGVDLYATLKCEAKNCEIYLDKTILHFEDTFLSLQRCISLNLINRSDYAMKYQWKRFKTKYDDMEQCREFRSKLEDLNQYEVLRNIQEANPNITDADLHRTFLQRIYDDELAEFDSTDQFLFHDPNFKFLENNGIIGPKSIVNIEVVFCPTKAESYQSIAYLEVTGRETRQPLKMVGTGLGPEVSLNFKVLDVENLYLCAKHQYEIVAKNEGNIPATLTYCHKSMDFGGQMSCSPDEVYINPGKCEKMVLEFSSTMQGKFLENLNFRIAESGEYVTCVFQGNVVCPLLSYNIQAIDFGIVAFGFAVEKEISIQNTTEVPIEFRICVLNDGAYEAITWVNFSRSHDASTVSKMPKEFSIYPDEATVAGNSAINIKITLVPNKAQKQLTHLHTYMWGSRKHYVELPIYYNCIVPTVECSPPKVDIRYCFINCPYDRIFTIKNISEVPGYILYNDMEEDDQGLSCKLSLTESFIEPGEEITIHLEIKGLQLGLHTKNLNFTVFGSEPNNLCKLTCDVQGPVICVNPEEIKFGFVPLLKWHSRKLNVMNDSPVPAFISIHVANPTFHVNPNEFKLEASEKLEVDISLYLTNVAKYTSILILNIVNSMDPLKVHVSAFGVGSCILFEPILEPKYDLGTLMTHNTFRVPFKMTNMGKDLQRFLFSKVKDMKSMKEETESTRGYPFLIEPNQFELQPKEQKTAYIEVYYTTPGLAELMYYCYSVDKTTKFTKIFEVKFIAHFEDPVLMLSKPSLHFRMDVTVDKTDAHLLEVYTVTNESYLALDIYVTLTHPFYALDENGSKTTTLNVNVASKTNFSFFVEFVPPSGVKKCLVSSGYMKIGFKLHPKVFTITLTGDVNYPTLFTYPEAIKNQHIAPTANCSKELIIKNISPLPVAYQYEWEVTSYTLEKLSTPRYNLSSVENSHDWKVDKIPRIPHGEPSPEQITTNHTVELLVRDEDDPGFSELPKLKILYETLLENIRFPTVHPDVTRKLMFMTKFFLFPITENVSYEVEDFFKILENMPRRKPEINEAMLNITPYRGCLEPYECSLVNFYIRPPLQTFLKANAKCRILGGAEDKIEISAVCGDIAYDISKMEVHFGYQLFCESLEEQINLYNTGHVGFEFAVLDDSNNPKPKITMDATTIGLLTVTPNMGTLAPNEKAALRIKYFPGITGEFNEYFVIEIGYLGPITVQVTGFAVYSQLYVMLPRPSLFDVVEPYLCYIAIGQLSKDPSHLHYHMKDVPEDNRLDEITTLILEKEEWFIVQYDDVNIPSLVDIDMAVERMIGHEFLQSNPQLLGERVSIRKKHFTIPNFLVPTYELAFGNVRRDGQYEQNVSVYNYGPTTCLIKLFFVDQKYLESRGFFVELNCQKIRLKEFGNLNVKFKPEVKGVDLSQPFISEVICVEVNQGARIPIRLTAFVGIPTTELSVQCMDFCGVVVGSCKRKIICLYNVGFVEAKWSCSIDTPIFFVRKKEGLLAAGESEEILVFFEPRAKGPRQGVMTFHIEGNNEDLTAYLNGYGREPNFVIKESVVQFPPVLQYSPPLEETFLIQNTSSFPTEVFMCDYDRQISLHERICHVFWREMNAKKLYVARSLYGSTPSDIYRYLYKELLLDRLRKEKSFTEVMKLSRTDVRGSSESVEHLLDALELRVESSMIKKKPPQDIFLDADIEDDKPAVERTTKIIVFHGNKYTDYLKAANDASRMLRIPRYNLDSMIIDILVENRTAFTKEVNEIIEEAYLIRMDAEDCLCRESSIEDETEELWRKLNAIHSLEPINKTKVASQKKEPKVKADKGDQLSLASSKMSRRTLSINTADTFQGIPEEMIIQILSDRIDQIDRMILESLESIFLPNVQVALRCFLKAAKDISCVYFVFFTCTLEEHTALETEEENKNAAREANRRQALRKKLLELDDYTSLTEEEKEILTLIQEDKRRRSNQKRTDLRSRIQDDLKESGQEPKANDLKSFWAQLDSSFSRSFIPKLPPKALKVHDSSHQQHSATSVTKESKETKSTKDKKANKERQKDSRPADETSFYFYQYDIKLSEMLFLLENWNRKDLELEKDFPNFASLMASNRKDARYTSKEFLKKTSRSRSKSLGSVGVPNETAENDENENVVSTAFNAEVGYPVWLINQAHKKRSTNVIEPIMDLLKKMITINCLTPSKRACKETEIVYTILPRPAPRKYREKLEVFDLIKCETRGENSTESLTPTQPNEDEIQKNSNTTLNVVTKKKQKKRRLTLEPTPSDIEQISNVHARFLLEPGCIQELTVLFKPLYCGFFKYVYNFEVVGTCYKEKIVVQASCDFPRIDTSPYTLFPHQVHSVDSKTMFLNGVYVISQQTLDFGTILLIPQHLLEMKSSISMLNTSGMTCDITISFKTGSEVFYCDEDQKCIEVKPGRQHVLPIYAKPPEEGLFKETLLITIKNNPRVQEIHLSCFACPLKFQVTPKNVNFNKVILGKTESEKIIFRNFTSVMVYFEFEVDVSSEFRISTFNGYLDPCSSLDVMVTFIPEIIGDRKESLILRVFDKEKQFPQPIYTEVLNILAEVATFPLEYATSIDLGLVKGKMSHFFPFTINNTGKYDVKILLTKPIHQGNTVAFGECFKMKHMEYVVQGNSKYSNNCRFTCDREVSFVDCPVVYVTILDNYRNSAIDHFTFSASARVTLSKFELCPHGEYFFGYQNVNTVRSSLLTLKNIGDFDFKYTILTPAMVEEQAIKKESKKEGVQMGEIEPVSSIPSLTASGTALDKKSADKSTRSTTGSRKKGKLKSKSRSNLDLLSEVTAGIFTITPAMGVVQPGESVTINIDSRPVECEKYKETIIFFVSEPSFEDRRGRKMNLHVEGAEPRINFNDYRFMFPLDYVVENIEDLPHIGENFVFETNKKILQFGKVALNNSVSTKLRVPNIGHVTATVRYDIKDNCGFSVDSKVIDIAPYKAEYNVIQFEPKAIGICTGILEMKCLGVSSDQETNCIINLMGEACMPTIEIFEPEYRTNGDDTQLCFGPIPVTSSCERSVIIRNRGQVKCKVVVEIIGDPEWFLTLSLRAESGGDDEVLQKIGKSTERI
ncbi:hydrocephalus-inducing protein homolog [Coccinella septempunctata]|uniref:hydrocephalus-inducing protein homolog n=1 Tax=Coccinella septempunctata TaxID=41139 RepID=UPI001D07274F|nr:hydrocephalus-inducing protein homolog [Coccinella septempunctata]